MICLVKHFSSLYKSDISKKYKTKDALKENLLLWRLVATNIDI